MCFFILCFCGCALQLAFATRSAVRKHSEEEHLERLLRVGTCLAQCGYGAQVGQLAACARAFRADAQLWTAHARHRGPTGCTALMHAAYTGNVDRIQFLVERGADEEAATTVEVPDSDFAAGTTVLMLACKEGHCEAVRSLVECCGADVNAGRTTDGKTALMWACQNGHLETARYLVERCGASVNAALTDDGSTALMWASEIGHLEIMRFLVERGGANANAARTTDGHTALMMWACEKGHLEIVRILVERGGANVNAARSTDGYTAFLWASQNGHHEVVRLLLQRGALVNAARAFCGRTPLMFASMNGHATTVRLLLEHGALQHLTDHAGCTARAHASSHPLVLAVLA
jgi:ankyrin repeat protein